MKITIVRMFDSKFTEKKFYHLQELGLAKALVNFGHKVIILLPKTDIRKVCLEIYNKNIKIHYIPSGKIGSHVYFNFKYIKESNPDLIWLQSDNQFFAPNIMKKAKKNNIRCFNYIGTLYSDTNNKLKKSIMQLLTKRNIRYYKNGIIFTKTSTVKKQLNGKGVERVETIPVGLDSQSIPIISEDSTILRNKWGLPLDKKIILFVGRLEHYKKPMKALELLGMLSTQYCLVMVGDGNLKDNVLKKMNTFSEKKQFFYFDKIENSKMHEIYHCSDYFVNFNDKEIFGMSILEAMYQKCIVIAFHAPGPDDIIKNKINGYLVNSIEEMKNYIENSDYNIGKNAYIRIKENFTWNYAAKIVTEKYNALEGIL